jgi:hypothetical protein
MVYRTGGLTRRTALLEKSAVGEVMNRNIKQQLDISLIFLGINSPRKNLLLEFVNKGMNFQVN